MTETNEEAELKIAELEVEVNLLKKRIDDIKLSQKWTQNHQP